MVKFLGLQCSIIISFAEINRISCLQIMDESSYHKVLGTTPDDSEEYVTARYKELSLVWHPDKCGRHDVCTDSRKALFNERQQEINDAYRAIKKSIKLKSPRGTSTSQGGFNYDIMKHLKEISIPFEDACAYIGVIVCAMLLLVVARKAVAVSWKAANSARNVIGPLAMMAALYYLNLLVLNSEYGDLVLYLSIPTAFYSISPLVRMTWDAIRSTMPFFRRYWPALLLLTFSGACLLNPTRMILPKTSALCAAAAITQFKQILGNITILLMWAGCLYYLHSNSAPSLLFAADPWSEFVWELNALYVYIVSCVFRVISYDPKVLAAVMNIQSCYLEAHYCPQIYIDRQYNFLKGYLLTNWVDIAMEMLSCWPYLLLAMGVYRVMCSLAQVMFPALFADEETIATRGELSPPSRLDVDATIMLSAEEKQSLIDRVVLAFPTLGREDAQVYLASRGWNFNTTITYLSSPAGKASRAALSRMDPPVSSVSRNTLDLQGSTSSGYNRNPTGYNNILRRRAGQGTETAAPPGQKTRLIDDDNVVIRM